MVQQIGKINNRNIKQIIDNELDIDPLVRNFGMTKRDKAVNQTSTLIEIHKLLSNFDLNKNEINVFLFLARFGGQKASRVSENLGITRSETYKILRRLESQGIILRLVQKPYKYIAIPLEDIFDMFIQKKYHHVQKIEVQKEKLVEKWAMFNKPADLNVKGMVFQVLEGTNQIYIKIKEMLNESNDHFTMAVSDDILLWLYNTPLFEIIEERNKSENKVECKLVSNNSDITQFVLSNVAKEAFDFNLVDDWSIPGFLVADGKEIILLIRNGIEELYAMWTNYDSLVSSNEMLFSMIWDANIKK
jgi:sugar-specific transcriptional regulator TrmB